jgi:hypothetical protein
MGWIGDGFKQMGKRLSTKGTGLAVPYSYQADDGFTGCGKTKFFEGDGLQAVRKWL